MNIHLKLLQIFSLVCVVFTAACGQKSTKKPQQESYESCLVKEMLFIAGNCYDGSGIKGADLRSLLFSNAPFLETLDKPKLEICILAESKFDQVRPELESETRRSIQLWLKPLHEVSHSLPTHISFVHPEFSESSVTGRQPQGKLCPDSSDAVIVYLSDLTSVNFEKEDRAFALVEDKEIWLSPSNMNPGTLLHEFGHLFGLADIYIEDEWTCRKDFPNSIMCQGEWNSLLPADRVAVQRNYCLYTDGKHPTCFNFEKKELLSFLPKLRSNRDRTYTYRDPYMMCENDEMRFTFQPYSFYLYSYSDSSSFFFGLYASDPSTVEESYGPKLARNVFSVEDVAVHPKDRGTLSLELEIRDEQVHIRFDAKGQEQNASFSNCYMDPRLVEYYRSRGVAVPAPLMNPYMLLKSQVQILRDMGEVNPEDGLPIFVDYAFPANAEILVLTRDDQKLVKTKSFAAVTKSYEHADPYHKYFLDLKALDLSSGSYETYIIADDMALYQISFSIAGASAAER